MVQLQGDRFDIEEYPRWFPTGDIAAIEEAGNIFLVGPRFEALGSAEKVYAAARDALDKLTGALLLFMSNIHRPTIGGVFHEDAKGTRHAFVFVSGIASARSKLHAVLGGGGTTSSQTQAQHVLSAAKKNSHFEAALALWGDPIRTWPRLYRILEEIEHGLRKHVDRAKLCSATQRTRFTRSANAAEVAGVDSRHASGQFKPPSNPMTLDQANSFVSAILHKVLT